MINYIFYYSKVTLMVEEMDITKEINKSEQKTLGSSIYLRCFSDLSSEILETACSSLWTLVFKGAQAIGYVLSEMCFRGRFTC